MDLYDIFKDSHYFAAGKTGSGKTTLIRSFFLSPTKDKIFRCHILPDNESKSLYDELGIPTFQRCGEVAHAFFYEGVTHCTLDPEAEFVTGKDPIEEILDMLQLIFEEKYYIANNSKYTTPPAYFLMDEAQKLMTAQNIPDGIKLVASEGRKIDMWLFCISQRLSFLNQDFKTQASIGLGYMELEDAYLKSYNLRAPTEFFTFNINRNGKIHVLKSRKLHKKELRKLFQSGRRQLTPINSDHRS